MRAAVPMPAVPFDRQDVMLPTADGQHLAGTFYAPARPNGVSTVINGGTGIPRGFYEAFAKHLASRGIATLTYDYRGIAGSAEARGTMDDWGQYDQVAALTFLSAQRPQDALTIVGHSLGGQILGLASNIRRVRAAFFVAAQHGHARHWKWPRKARMLLLWWVLIPGLTPLFGRFPGEYLGVSSLPTQVALNWARWGRSPHYVCDAQGRPFRPHNAQVTFPIRWLSFTDDLSAPFAAVEALRGYYPAAQQERLHLSPQDLGVPAVGHFGFFRRSMPVAHWDAAADWLIAQAKG
jgi:predicted alpha/beta hydrolase